MAVTQLSVFLDNSIGRLAEVTRILGEHHVNIRGFSVADTADFGILRLLVNDEQGALDALRAAKFTVHTGPIVLARIPDAPGGLANALESFATHNINVEYAYAIVKSLIAFGIEDIAAGEALLVEKGIPLVSPQELMEI
ncbi:MAG TPA: ACT domain-containing protein [Armatimonadota bacterium]|nr:ACT domain-containing protein [Armatimonadota bacterium]